MILAHAFGERYELPIPLALFVGGGGVVVLLSFLLVFRREVEDVPGRAEADRGNEGRSNPVGDVIGVLLLVGLIAAGLGGSQEVAENIVPTTFWLVLWIAVPLSCGIIGNWTRWLNPFATLARAADSDRLRDVLLGDARRVVWPRRLGWWPAVVTYVVVACGELVYNLTATLPRVTALGLLVGALLSLVMGLLFGAGAWLDRGEMFSVLFATWGRLGWFRFGSPGRRGFGGGLDAPLDASPSRLVFVLLLLVSVSFDGLISTPFWGDVRSRFVEISGGSSAGIGALTTLSLLLLGLLTLLVFGAFAASTGRLGGHPAGPAPALAALFPSLLPIAFGYLLAHNLQYLLVNAQLLVPLIGNPVGKPGWQWLPAPFDDSYEVRTTLVPSSANWYIAITVIVAAHIAAVVVAHRHLARAGATERQARRSEFPWLLAMVGYTMISLWLLAQPLVEESSHQESSHQALGSMSTLLR